MKLLIIIAAFAVGFIFGLAVQHRTTMGTLVINETDPDKDVYQIQIDNLDILPKKRQVLLKISNSHK